MDPRRDVHNYSLKLKFSSISILQPKIYQPIISHLPFTKTSFINTLHRTITPSPARHWQNTQWALVQVPRSAPSETFVKRRNPYIIQRRNDLMIASRSPCTRPTVRTRTLDKLALAPPSSLLQGRSPTERHNRSGYPLPCSGK